MNNHKAITTVNDIFNILYLVNEYTEYTVQWHIPTKCEFLNVIHSSSLTVLRRIRQLEKKSLITHGHLNPLKLALSRVTAKLSDAQSFLRNATSTIEEMRDRNSGNVLKFQRIEVISHDLQGQVNLSFLVCLPAFSAHCLISLLSICIHFLHPF